MKEKKGWILLHRKIEENPDYPTHRREAFTPFERWIDLLLQATFKEKTSYTFSGKTIWYTRGEVLGSVRFLADRWHCSKRTVYVTLHALSTRHQISIELRQGVQIIKILNYQLYQDTKQVKEEDKNAVYKEAFWDKQVDSDEDADEDKSKEVKELNYAAAAAKPSDTEKPEKSPLLEENQNSSLSGNSSELSFIQPEKPNSTTHQQVRELFDAYKEKFRTRVKSTDPIFSWGQCEKLAKPHLKSLGLPRMIELLDLYFQTDNELYRENVWSLSCFLSAKTLNKLNLAL